MNRDTPNADLHGIRRSYEKGQLLEADCPDNPFLLLQSWLQAALDAQLDGDPTAMTLSTVDASGAPSSRVVLLKSITSDALLFYTNHASRKGRDIAGNPAVCGLLQWLPLERQAGFSGTAAPLARADAEAYFSTRPRESQLAAWCSAQSQPIESRQELEARFHEAEVRFEGQAVPMPRHWGGYAITPHRFEFWQGRRGRLHDRIVYLRVDGHTPEDQPIWTRQRLQP